MLDFFINIYCKIAPKRLKFFGIDFFSGIRYIIRVTANFILPKWLKLTRSKNVIKNTETFKEHRIIVSLTTFPDRIDKIWIVLEAVLRQTKRPDLVILWLSRDQFKDINELPRSLTSYLDKGCTIRFVDDDLRSHKKYYYALKEFPNDVLITLDDDIFYSRFLVEDLWKKHVDFPQHVICNYGLEMKREIEKQQLKPYNQWRFIIGDAGPSSEIFFGSGGGTLFPPDVFYKDVLSMDLFLKYTRNADDVWLNAMIRLNNRQVIKIKRNSFILPIMYKKSEKLSDNNLLANQNDKQIEGLSLYYKNTLNRDPFERQIPVPN